MVKTNKNATDQLVTGDEENYFYLVLHSDCAVVNYVGQWLYCLLTCPSTSYYRGLHHQPCWVSKWVAWPLNNLTLSLLGMAPVFSEGFSHLALYKVFQWIYFEIILIQICVVWWSLWSLSHVNISFELFEPWWGIYKIKVLVSKWNSLVYPTVLCLALGWHWSVSQGKVGSLFSPEMKTVQFWTNFELV